MIQTAGSLDIFATALDYDTTITATKRFFTERKIKPVLQSEEDAIT